MFGSAMENIRQLTVQDLDNYFNHLARHLQESGADGFIFHPLLAHEHNDDDQARKKILEKWSTTPGDRCWQVTWGIFAGESIVGHVQLVGSELNADKHRARLAMGIEAKYRGQGYGRILISHAIEWARTQDFLSWIDLEVFAHNKVALKLYQSFGFKSVGTTADRFRVQKQSIDDHHLVLNLKGRFPNGYYVEHCDSERFQSVVGNLSEAVFDDNLCVWRNEILSSDETARLNQLNDKYRSNLKLHSILFYEGALAGWSFGYQDTSESFLMANSAILPAFRGKSLYSHLLDEVIEYLHQKGIQRIWSNHCLTNNHIIIPKLKRGFLITGMRVDDCAGTLVQLTYFTNATRKKIMDFRVGQTRPDEELKKFFKF